MTPDEKRARLERIKQIERWILLPILLCAALAFFSFGRAQVVGVSMEPTLHSGQRLTVLKAYRTFAPLKVGDIVVIDPGPGRDSQVVKRIVFMQNPQGSRTWPAVIETPAGSYHTDEVFPPGTIDRTVPHGIYVLGDNINDSSDSRDYGAVQQADVFGKVLGVK